MVQGCGKSRAKLSALLPPHSLRPLLTCEDTEMYSPTAIDLWGQQREARTSGPHESRVPPRAAQ